MIWTRQEGTKIFFRGDKLSEPTESKLVFKIQRDNWDTLDPPLHVREFTSIPIMQKKFERSN